MRPRFVLASAAMALAVALPAASVPAVAHAQARPAASSKAQADALFRKGREAMNRGEYAQAKAHLTESQALDPSPGTTLNLAICEVRLGKPLRARAMLEQLLAAMPQDDPRRATAEAERAAAAKLVASVTVRLARGAPAGVVVSLDGRALRADELGASVELEPGEHALEARGADGGTHTEPLALEPGQSRDVELAAPAPRASGASGASSASPTGPTRAPSDQPVVPSSEPSASGKRTAGFVIGGVGVAALGVGAVFGALALGKKSAYADTCDGEPVCADPTELARANELASQGNRFATVSTLGLALGAVGVGVGAYLILSNPQVRVTAGLGRITLARSF